MGLIQDMFEKGKERWIKFRYVDTDKCIKAFTSSFNRHDKEGEIIIQEQGYEVLSIGCIDEWTPQLAALVELQADVTTIAAQHGVPDHAMEAILLAFQKKQEKVKQEVIKQAEDFKE